ncbi:MAG: tRNA (adenosine(37)-N6)-dimethylallyltransferase MiaA [Rikenellaceae bacterium]
MTKRLIVIAGSTGVGKTDMSIKVANHLNAHILCGDSRQIYKEMTIGTAVPTKDDMATVPHHLFQFVSAKDRYNVGRYERDALLVLDDLFKRYDNALVVGGSGLYLDALCKGIDPLPEADHAMREEMLLLWHSLGGRETLLKELQERDSELWDTIDKDNPIRVCRALEVCRLTGEPFSKIRRGKIIKRPFEIVKIGLRREREELYDRINTRVDLMFSEGLLEEAHSLLPLREYNALQTVGYRELFDYFDGNITLETAKELIKRNTRHYAKRQTTWFGGDKEISWFHPNDYDGVIDYIEKL